MLMRASASYERLMPSPGQWDESVRRSASEPDLNVIRTFARKRASKLRKRWLQEFYSGLSVQELEDLIKKKKRLAKERRKEANEESVSYKYGRIAMIALAIFSIPIDGWKLYQEVGRTERALDGPTSIEVFDYYSSAITTHVIGLAGAVDNSLILTIACRMMSTILYQTTYGTKGNSTVPTDPKELQKYIRENVPAHRLPKGYRFTDDLHSTRTGTPGRKKGTRRSKTKKKKTKSKKTATANTKKTAKKNVKNRSTRKSNDQKKRKSGQQQERHKKKG